MPTATCLLCAPPVRVHVDAPYDSPLAVREFNNLHHDRTHGHLAGVELAGPGQDFHTRAIAEVKRLAATGEEWCMWQVFAAVGDPPDHKTTNGQFATEVSHLGLAHVVRYAPSKRPGSNSSAVAYWRGGPTPARQENVA